MPVTYNLIASNTLSSSAASVTFSAIPGTYTDLVVRMSVRTSPIYNESLLSIKINNDSTTLYSNTNMRGNGTTAVSTRATGNDTNNWVGLINAGTTTSNTFSSIEINIPSYTASQSKVLSSFSVMENNATLGYDWASANLYRSNTALTQLEFTLDGGNFVSGSSFFLYGIKNS